MTYHHHLRGGLPGPLLERTLRWAELTPRSGDIFRDFPAYHLHVMEALNLCGRWAETLRVAELAHSNYPRLTLYRERTTFYSAFLCHHAMALLHEGQEATARQILEELRRGPHLPDSSSYPTFHHSRIHMLRLEAESLVRTGDPPAAIERLRDVVRISRTLGCRFFEVRALGRLAALSAALGDVDAFNRAERRIDEVFSEAAFHSPGDAAHRPGPGPVHG